MQLAGMFEKKMAGLLAWGNKRRPIRKIPYISGWSGESPGASRQHHTFVHDGYQQNPVAHRAVTLIARSVASVPWSVSKGGRRLGHHPLLDLMNRPNPTQGGSAFTEAVMTSLLLAGNAYIQATGSGEGIPPELYTLRPECVSITLDDQGWPEGYVYARSQNVKTFFPCDPDPLGCPLLHLKTFHPLQDTTGLSPLEAAALAIDQHNAVSRHNLALLEQGGRPTGALMVKQGPHGGVVLTDEQRQDLRRQVQESFSGPGNAGRILVLEGSLDWKEMGASLKDMDFVEGKNLSAREIAQVFGVPPMLAGVPGDATFANYREARLHFWEDTVLPWLEMLTGELNRWLAPRFGATIRLGYDTDAIPALSPKREMVWSKIACASFLTINEKRQAIGYPPLPGGVCLQPAGPQATPEGEP